MAITSFSGSDFENYLIPTIRRNFPKYEGFRIEMQSTIKGGLRPDFVVSKRVVHAVIEAKDKDTLQFRDVDQVIDYANILDAPICIIYIARYTEVSENLKDYAFEEKVEITKTLWSH